MTKGLVANGGIDRLKWERPFRKGSRCRRYSKPLVDDASAGIKSVMLSFRARLSKGWVEMHYGTVGPMLPKFP